MGNQMEIANARIPYWSTLQLDSDVQIEGAPPGPTPNLYGLSGPMGPAHPSPQPFVRGEKQWMDNAQNIGDWGDSQMMIANTCSMATNCHAGCFRASHAMTAL